MRYLCILLLLPAAAIYGQNQTSQFIKRPALETGLIFQRWTSSAEQTLDEIIVPLVLHYPVSERVSVSVLNTPTYARFARGNVSSRLTAFTDTKISAACILGEERALLNFGVSAPTGRTAFNAGETEVAQAITSRALAMPTSYFGGGVELSASLAAAVEWGKWILGGSLGGVYKGSFTPTAGSAQYLPGPEISLSLGLDRPFGERYRIFGDVNYTWYAADKLGGAKIFQADGKINFNLAGILASENWQTSFGVDNNLKRQSPFALNNSFSVSYGNELNFSAEIARQMNRDSALLASTFLRVHGKNNIGVGEAVVIGFGPGWRGMLLPQLQIEAATHFAIGKLNGNQILGGEVKLGFIYQL